MAGIPLRVTVLDLYRRGLTGEIPPELGNLTQLRHVWLEDNRLSGEIPAGLGGLGNLESLWLQSNDFSGEMPQDFTGLSALRAFLFHNNSGLCAPVNAAFQSWLSGSQHRLWQQLLINGPVRGEGRPPKAIHRLGWLVLEDKDKLAKRPPNQGMVRRYQ